MGRHSLTCTCKTCLEKYPKRKKLPPNDSTKTREYKTGFLQKRYQSEGTEKTEPVETDITNDIETEKNLSGKSPFQEFLEKQKQFTQTEPISEQEKKISETEPENKTDIKTDSGTENKIEPKPVTDKKTDIKQNLEDDKKLLITGYMLLIAIDSLYPDFILKLYGWLNKKAKLISSDDISLTEDDIEELEPLADEICRMYLYNLPPLTLFLIMTNIFYVSNIKSAIRKLDIKPKK